MKALDRKALRDLWHLRGQALAIALVVASGVATFVMSLSNLESIQRALDAYYDQARFAHVFAHLERAPDPLADRIAEIPGVQSVETRIAESVTLDMPDLEEPVSGRLLSLPALSAQGLHRLHMRRGRDVERSGRREVLVNEAFALAHDLEPGDTINAVLNGQREELPIAGLVLSPEFIYQIREGDLLPDDLRFGVLWMDSRELAAAFDMEGAFNDVLITLMPGASEAEVIRRIDVLTARYGGFGAYGRRDNVSHKFVTNEISQLRAMTIGVPAVFFTVSAFLLNMVLMRLIAVQREQIASLKAIGYSRTAIGAHYLEIALGITLVGAAIGIGVGAWLGSGLTVMYARFFHFPVFDYQLRGAIVLAAIGLSAGACVLGTSSALARAMRLPPAEAMRPQPPASFEPTIIERLGLERLLSPIARMVLREIERRPLKSAISCLGIALAAAVLIVGNYLEDAVEYTIGHQFDHVMRYDASVTLIDPRDASAIAEIRHLPGVRRCEPFRTLAVRLVHGHRSRRVGVTGLDRADGLFQLADIDGRRASLPPGGLVVSNKLAELLHVSLGEEVTMEVLEDERPTVRVPVTGLLDDFAGLSAYMHIDALNRLLHQGDRVSGAYLLVDDARADRLYARLKEAPHVAGVGVTSSMLESFRRTIAENLLLMKTFFSAFAIIIAFGVVYNGARISLAERSRELATLRVIGFTRAEVSLTQLGELALLTVVGIPIGLWIGRLLVGFVSSMFDSELFRIPAIVAPATYGSATIVVLVATLLSGLVVRRMLDTLDLVAVLKARE